MPVDAADLDAVVVLGREVAAEGADRHEPEDREPHEDVGAVEAREAEEDRAEGLVVRREADPRVLDRLREEEGQAHEEGQDEPCLHPGAVAALDRGQRPVDREARRHEDERVDAGHELRQLELRRRPRLVPGYADEEVGGEERPEEHHLRGDEQQHPEHARRDPRALVGRGRPVVLERLGVPDAGHQAEASTADGSTTTWSTGTPASARSRSTRWRRSQPDFWAG